MDTKYNNGIPMNIKNLEKKVQNLCKQLRSSGKIEPANYYENLFDQIKSSISDCEKKSALDQIISSGKLADLANFDSQEDQLFDFMYEEAKSIKAGFVGEKST